MRGSADFERIEDGGGTLRFSGNLSLACLRDLPQRLDAVEGPVARLDLSGVERLDTVGAWLIHRFARDHHSEVAGLQPDEQHLLEQVAAAEHPVELPPRHADPFTRMLGARRRAAWTRNRVQVGAAVMVLSMS